MAWLAADWVTPLSEAPREKLRSRTTSQKSLRVSSCTGQGYIIREANAVFSCILSWLMLTIALVSCQQPGGTVRARPTGRIRRLQERLDDVWIAARSGSLRSLPRARRL